MTDLFVESIGDGERVVLVHGSGPRAVTWAKQRVLADRYGLVIPDRRGYGRSPSADPDFEVDADDIAELLGDGAHLVGFSYGGVGSLLAASRRPEAIRTLTVIEPPAFAIASDNHAVEALVGRLRRVYDQAAAMTPDEFDAAFDTAIGFEHPSQPLDPDTRRVVDSVRRERPPWEADIPLEVLARTPFPKLVVSGGWSAAFDGVCDVLERGLAATRAAFPDYGGHGVQHAEGFNEILERFWGRG